MERAVLFWGVCIPFRLYLASRGNAGWLRTAAIIISYRWLTGKEVGNEGVFGGPAFWADERPIHGLFWGAYATTGKSQFLYYDTLFGATNWLLFHVSHVN